jgi:uncharacterized membrane protein
VIKNKSKIKIWVEKHMVAKFIKTIKNLSRAIPWLKERWPLGEISN